MKLKKIFTKVSTLFSITTCYLLLATNTVLALDWSTGEDDPATFKDLEVVFSNILGVLVALAGLATFIMLLIGGFTFMTSAGNPEKNAKAQATLTWGIVGLIILLGAWFILRFISDFTGVDVTIFRVIIEPS